MNEQGQDERQKTIEAIKEAKHILLAIGQRPTGDQIGTLVALLEGLKGIGKDLFLVCPDPLPKSFSFLKNSDQISQRLKGSKDFIIELSQDKAKADHLGYKLEDKKLKITITPQQGNFTPDDISCSHGDYQYDLIITLGISGLPQLGKVYQADPEIFYKTLTVNIDNNPKNQLFGQINWLDRKASSLSEMMVSLMESLAIRLTEPIATALLTGLMTATDRFQSENTTAKALTVAAQLIGVNAKRDLIVRKLFQATPYLYLKSWGRIMENLTIDPTLKLAWSILSKEEISQLAISPESIKAALDQLLNKIEEAEIVALIQQTGPQQAKVSLRSQGQINVAELAQRFNGGGQPSSAGFILKGENFPELKKRIIRLLKSYQKEVL